jgi:ribose-phosphate pyrophosphokinase
VGDIQGKNCIIVDDMTETAGTLCAAAAALRKAGARKIFAGVSHAIIGKLALERLQHSAIEELITTDSVPHVEMRGVKLAEQSVAELLGEGIKRIHSSESVSSLFQINQ